MTPTSRTDWTMVDELVAQAGSHTPDYVDEVIAATARVRQRPAWTFPSRWLPAGAAQPHPALSPALVAALLGIALLGGLLAWAATRPPPTLPRPTGNGVIVWGVNTSGYNAAKNGGAEVGTIDPSTGAVTRLSDIHGGPAAFLPDGTRLAFFVGAGRGTTMRLHTSNPDGSDMVLVAEYPASEVHSVRPSPDGRWIVASDRLDDTSARRRIAVFATDGSEMRILDLGDLSGSDPSWAPTSDLVVFAGVSPDGSRSLYTIPVDGSAEPVPLVDVGVDATPYGVDPEPAWSPDGQWIAYLGITSGAQVPPTTAVHLVRPDGSEDHILAVPAGWSSTPTWAPDSRSLLVRHEIGSVESCVDPSAPGCGQWADREAHLVVVPVDGTPARRVGPSSAVEFLDRYAWSPDGRMIVARVETGAAGDQGVALIDVATNTWRVVADESGFGPISLSWQPVATAVPAPAAATLRPTPVSTPRPDILIGGRITDPRGDPVVGAAVHTEGTDNLLDHTDGDGGYRFKLAAAGTYRIWIGPIAGRLDHPAYVGPAGWTINPNLEDGSLWSWTGPAVIDLVVPDTTRISGTFVDADGMPYRNARIDASSPDTAPTSGNGTLLSLGTRTDDQGRFSLLVMPGTWELMVDGGEYRGIVEEVTVGAEPVDELVFTRARQP